jgi:predicted phosphoribosyltransferase
MLRDRDDAGRQLAAALQRLALPDPLVLALPRGEVVDVLASAAR